MKLHSLLAGLLLGTALLSHAPAASAQEDINLGLGSFDVFDSEDRGMLNLAYEGAYFWRSLRPVVGVNIDEDSGKYLYGGFSYDFALDNERRWLLSPTAAVGLYGHGASKDLGGMVEFRTGLEMDYRFENEHRLGLGLHHLSNASIYDRNPGAETLTVNYSVPVSLFGGRGY